MPLTYREDRRAEAAWLPMLTWLHTAEYPGARRGAGSGCGAFAPTVSRWSAVDQRTCALPRPAVGAAVGRLVSLAPCVRRRLTPDDRDSSSPSAEAHPLSSGWGVERARNGAEGAGVGGPPVVPGPIRARGLGHLHRRAGGRGPPRQPAARPSATAPHPAGQLRKPGYGRAAGCDPTRRGVGCRGAVRGSTGRRRRRTEAPPGCAARFPCRASP